VLEHESVEAIGSNGPKTPEARTIPSIIPPYPNPIISHPSRQTGPPLPAKTITKTTNENTKG
jgi:hypothetical protein